MAKKEIPYNAQDFNILDTMGANMEKYHWDYYNISNEVGEEEKEIEKTDSQEDDDLENEFIYW